MSSKTAAGQYLSGPVATASSIARPLDAILPGASIGESPFPIFRVMKICCGALLGFVSLGLCLMLACVELARAQPQMSGSSVKEMMSADEFNAAGLNKLSADELQKLDAWLQGYRQVTEQAAEKKATARASRTKMDLIVSRVDGSFNGLTGRTIIRLEDGTVWKQANADDRYRARVTDHPAAAVMHGVFGYKMRIEGTQEFYVDPVRNP
jgi:hypothetical protein